MTLTLLLSRNENKFCYVAASRMIESELTQRVGVTVRYWSLSMQWLPS